MMIHSGEAKLVGFREIGPEVRHFDFEVPAIQRFEFVPGQFVALSEELKGKRVTRAYSIASPPDDNRFELSLNKVKEGVFSPRLFELEPGQRIPFKGPYGGFTLRQPARDTVFVATGTGIAPFRSMLWSRLPAGAPQRFTLLFGVRYESALLYREELERFEREYPNFQFLPTITRPGEEWGGRRGRVLLHLDEALAGRRDLDVYICGLKEMVNDIRDRLLRAGFDRKQIIFERYD